MLCSCADNVERDPEEDVECFEFMEPDEFFDKLNQNGFGSTAAFVRHSQFESLGLTTIEIANALVRECKLTKYQANVLLNATGEPLRFGEYLILEKIGQGGMGVVFKAQKQLTDQRSSYSGLVALKVLPSSVSRIESAIRRFNREAELAAQLDHPNIVKAFDFGNQDGRYFISMEYVDGENVTQLIEKRESGLALLTAFEWLRDAANGLKYAHDHHVVHRDVKPSNLLVHRNGHLKILDMGLARSFSSDDGLSDESPSIELTMTGTVLGTTGYMAPEQALNSKKADHRSDIYSLGCTFYYFLVGKPIYGGDTMVEKIVAHRETPIPNLSKYRDDIPAAVQKLFSRMVAKKCEDRYQCCGELVEDIENCLKEFGHMWMIQRYLQEKKGKQR